MTTETQRQDGARAETANDTLSNTENRTEKQNDVPIEEDRKSYV
jgi:hypothetical protein